MKHTNNLNLTLYEPNDIFNVTGDSNSLNNNMKVIDAAVEKLDDNINHKITKFYASNLGEKSLHDSDNGKIEDLHIYGKSKQQQYSGKNLFDFNAWKDSISSVTNGTAVYGENSIKLTATDNHCDVLGENYITVKPSTTYTLSWNADNNKEGGIMIHMDGKPFLGVEDDNSNTKKITFTTNSNTTSIRIEFGVTIAGESITYSNIQLEVGETETSYEPYVGGVPAPNPNYPQEIKSVGYNGLDIISKDDKHFNLLLIRDNAGKIITKQPVSVVGKLGETIQFVVSATGTGLTYQWWQNVNNGKGWVIIDTVAARRSTFTMSALAYRDKYHYRCVVTDGNGNSETSNEVTLYVVGDDCEIKNASITPTDLVLYGLPVESGGNYTDSNGQQWIADELIYNADGTGKIVKHFNKAVLNGSSDEVWDSTTTKNGADTGTADRRFYITMPENLKPIPVENNYSISTVTMCYSYCVKSSFQTYNNTTGISLDAASHIIFYDANHCTLTINEWRTHLASNPIIVVYALSTPQEIELSTEELQALNNLPTYYPITNISATSGLLDADMIFNYPISLAEGWNYVKQQLGDTRNYIYSMDLQSAEAYVNSEYAVALMELEV